LLSRSAGLDGQPRTARRDRSRIGWLDQRRTRCQLCSLWNLPDGLQKVPNLRRPSRRIHEELAVTLFGVRPGAVRWKYGAAAGRPARLDQRPEIDGRAKAIVVVSLHQEYWSLRILDHFGQIAGEGG